MNTTIPDIDDTTAVLRALARSRGNKNIDNAWKKGAIGLKDYKIMMVAGEHLKRCDEQIISKITNRKRK